MIDQGKPSELLEYILEIKQSSIDRRLPSLKVLSDEMGVSITSLREQLEVAKMLGLVDVKPRKGISLNNYSFKPAIWESLSYAIKLKPKYFDDFFDLRMHVEKSYWHQAVSKLENEDKLELQELMKDAWKKLQGNPARIPHQEHRKLHLGIYKRLDNTFVIGILGAYWDAYEAEGLNIVTDYDYLKNVWNYHQRLVDCICDNKLDEGYEILAEHFELLYQRPE